MEIAQLIDRERQRFEVPGVAVAVVHDGAVKLAQGFGQRDIEADLPVTDRTLFAIASCTKAFTTTLMAMLVRDGLVEWDKPVREYLPYFRLHDPVASDLATIRDLLSHRTGLPRHDMVWYGNPGLDRRELVAQRLRHLPLSKGIREAYQYNNLMYLTAGLLAGEVLGSTWEDAIRTKLLEPLGMSSSCLSPAERVRRRIGPVRTTAGPGRPARWPVRTSRYAIRPAAFIRAPPTWRAGCRSVSTNPPAKSSGKPGNR